MRGILAFFVYIHHAVIWYVYLQEGRWKAPDDLLYANLGAYSVKLFFMITGFLFIDRVVNKGEINWVIFYKSRIFRIVPLYLFVLLFVFGISLWKTEFIINDVWRFGKQVINWLSFGIRNYSNINDFEESRYVVAGVIWTLTYEWFFYLLVPFIYLIIRRDRVTWWVLLCSGGVLLCFKGINISNLLSFVGGGLRGWNVS